MITDTTIITQVAASKRPAKPRPEIPAARAAEDFFSGTSEASDDCCFAMGKRFRYFMKYC